MGVACVHSNAMATAVGIACSAENSCEAVAWYALKVRTGSEILAAGSLRNQGYELFVPLYRRRRRYSDRIKTVDTAVFPGYIFCRFAQRRKLPVLRSTAVQYVVSQAGMPAAIPDSEIEAIARAVAAGALPGPYLRTGQRVRILAGPLTGLEGLLTSDGAQTELTLSVHLLQRSLSVAVDSDQVEPV